jgi:hypothetical protein
MMGQRGQVKKKRNLCQLKTKIVEKEKVNIVRAKVAVEIVESWALFARLRTYH